MLTTERKSNHENEPGIRCKHAFELLNLLQLRNIYPLRVFSHTHTENENNSSKCTLDLETLS